MPIYEFECTRKRHRFELFRSRSKAGAPARCPDCGSPARRLFTGAILVSGPSGAGHDSSPGPREAPGGAFDADWDE